MEPVVEAAALPEPAVELADPELTDEIPVAAIVAPAEPEVALAGEAVDVETAPVDLVEAVDLVTDAPSPAPTEVAVIAAEAETATIEVAADPVIEEPVEPVATALEATQEPAEPGAVAVAAVEPPVEEPAEIELAPESVASAVENSAAIEAVARPAAVEAESDVSTPDDTDSQPPAAAAMPEEAQALPEAVASQPVSTPVIETEPVVEPAKTPARPATAAPTAENKKAGSKKAGAAAAAGGSSPVPTSTPLREVGLTAKPSTRSLPALHRSQTGAPCPVCAGTRWMKVSATLERCPRCSVLRLDPGDEAVQPMETQDLVLLRRVEAFRRESRERVMAVMNASHVSTGDLAELSLTPEQLADLRSDGNPHIFGSFGMCVLPFALEQSREPVALLRSVHDMLVPGGRLLVASFDPLSLRSLIFGAQWSGLRLPGQVYSFRRQHVERMLREAGFEKPRVERVSGCLRAAKPSHDHGPKFEMLALWRTIQNWGAASMFDAAKA
ncbi:MAG: hypothetical protein NTZ56_20300 [Acidobacteria bacterium]|nr:hypothetical protein [Acidobacteriota bacterium]